MKNLNRMVKIIYYSFVIILVFFSTSCSKYDEGPTLSFKSPEKRITGKWLLDKYYVNDNLVNLNELGIEKWEKTFNADSSGMQTIKLIGFEPVNEDFEWQFDDKKLNFRERFKTSDNQWTDFTKYKKILRLSSSDLWYIEMQGDDEIKYFFVKK